MARLTPKRRIAITLRFWADMAEADIASAMDVRPGTVKSLISGTFWFVATVPDGVDTVTVSPHNDMGGIVGPIARPVFAESIG